MLSTCISSFVEAAYHFLVLSSWVLSSANQFSKQITMCILAEKTKDNFLLIEQLKEGVLLLMALASAGIQESRLFLPVALLSTICTQPTSKGTEAVCRS